MTTRTEKSTTAIDDASVELADREAALDRLAGLLPADELQDALKGLGPEEITGPGGLLTQLAGRVIETALGAELTEHLGYPAGQAPPGGTGNHRNGSTAKTVQTELGAVQVKTPRDRQGTFEPQLVGKRQTRLAGLDEKAVSNCRCESVSDEVRPPSCHELGRCAILEACSWPVVELDSDVPEPLICDLVKVGFLGEILA
jgi:Transposase, Mutator family